MQTLTARINGTVEKFTADPAAGMASPSVAATLLNGHARLSSGPFNWESDLGPAVGGENLAPSPTAYLLGALAGCGVVFMRDTLAPLFEVTLDDVQATASCSSDAAGLLGIEDRNPMLEDLAITIRVTSPDPAERLEPMFEAWRERCPIFLALRNANPVYLDIQVTGDTKE
jgi:uncharacterized OsmC-like protein